MLESMPLDDKDEWPAARLEDPDYGYIDGIVAATRQYPLVNDQEDEIDTALGHSENNAPACAITGSAMRPVRRLRRRRIQLEDRHRLKGSSSQARTGRSPARRHHRPALP